MRFCHLDRITHISEGQRLEAVKGLSLAEHHLADHFPRFPVMPGVLMLESMYQASMWLLLITEDFSHPFVTLAEVTNVKFHDFVQPGDLLRVTTEMVSSTPDGAKFSVKADIHSGTAVKGRLELRRYRLADQESGDSARDDHQRYEYQSLLRRLLDPRHPLNLEKSHWPISMATQQ